MFEKRKCLQFYKYIQRINVDDPSTWEDYNLSVMTMTELYEAFGLGE